MVRRGLRKLYGVAGVITSISTRLQALGPGRRTVSDASA